MTSVRPIERDIFISSKRYLGYYHGELWLSIPQVSFDTREIELVNLSSELIRAARALLRWDQRQLADRSSVSLPTVKRLEAKRDPWPLTAPPWQRSDVLSRMLAWSSQTVTSRGCGYARPVPKS